MLSVVMPSVVMPSVVMPNVVMLSFMAAYDVPWVDMFSRMIRGSEVGADAVDTLG
jgi:hypothetical protein